MSDILSIHNKIQLRMYFKANIPPPKLNRWWWWALSLVPEELKVDAGGIPLSLGVPKAIHKAAFPFKITCAVYLWVYPGEVDINLRDGFPRILTDTGLKQNDQREVVSEMLTEIERWVSTHSSLERWLRLRAALLQFLLPQEPSRDLGRSLILLRNQQIRVLGLLWQSPRAAVEEANDLVNRALHGAAQATHGELGGDSPGDLNASLMLPFRDVSQITQYLSSICSSPRNNEGLTPVEESKRRADVIWFHLDQGKEPRTNLVVAAETVRDEHVGFWVPIVEGDRGKRLPGAPKAYDGHAGDCVFTQDPPTLDGFSELMNKTWQDHVRYKVRGVHFVSLPFIVERNEGLGKDVVAVLNVNANPPQGKEWYRAMHEVWLERARDAAMPFVEIAFYATLTKFAVLLDGNQRPGPALDTLAREWKVLPGTSAEVLPPQTILRALPGDINVPALPAASDEE